jgi:hypothetical protein
MYLYTVYGFIRTIFPEFAIIILLLYHLAPALEKYTV